MDADTNFKLMKDTITAFADMYGMSKINYAVVAYGEKPTKWFDFQSQPSDFDALKRIVVAITRETGIVALDKSLEEARRLFDAARPQARKVETCNTKSSILFLCACYILRKHARSFGRCTVGSRESLSKHSRLEFIIIAIFFAEGLGALPS